MKKQKRLSQERKREKREYLATKKGRLVKHEEVIGRIIKISTRLSENQNHLARKIVKLENYLIRQAIITDAIIKKGLVTQWEFNQVLLEAEWNHYNQC